MISIIKVKVKEVIYKDGNITRFIIDDGNKSCECINYNQLTGEVGKNDMVLLNTTAVELGLGSGGYHYVVSNLSSEGYENIGKGHIMKLRYTPMQINCLSAEAPESPYHNVFNNFKNLDGLTVIAGTLHSMLAPIAIALKGIAGKSRIVFIMTDGGALPVCMSDTVRKLCSNGILKGTVTYGNAFGGDLECINIYSALIAAKEILKADAVIVSMGPGIAGTATKYGYSGIEQGHIIDSVNDLGGKAVAVPRISFSDERSRHRGLSHHTSTSLGELCHTSAFVAVPELPEPEAALIKRQLEESGIANKHKITYWNSSEVEMLLLEYEDLLSKMGKGFMQDREYFITCGLSAYLAT